MVYMKKASSFLVLAIATVMIGTINANAVEMRGVSKVIGNEQNGPHDAETHPPIHVKHADLTSSIGYTPQQIKHAYSIDALKLFGVGQKIAIVDAYDDPTVLKDLAVFDHKYGLPVCTIANGCFSKVYSAGFKPRFDPGWAIEISLDVQWAHAIAPGAKILLVEAPNASLSSLLHAVDRAVAKGAHQVSMSWGAPEFSSETAFDF